MTDIIELSPHAIMRGGVVYYSGPRLCELLGGTSSDPLDTDVTDCLVSMLIDQASSRRRIAPRPAATDTPRRKVAVVRLGEVVRCCEHCQTVLEDAGPLCGWCQSVAKVGGFVCPGCKQESAESCDLSTSGLPDDHRVRLCCECTHPGEPHKELEATLRGEA